MLQIGRIEHAILSRADYQLIRVARTKQCTHEQLKYTLFNQIVNVLFAHMHVSTAFYFEFDMSWGLCDIKLPIFC